MGHSEFRGRKAVLHSKTRLASECQPRWHTCRTYSSACLKWTWDLVQNDGGG